MDFISITLAHHLFASPKKHPSVSHHKDVVERKLAKELALGRIAGPFLSPPFVNYQSSPLGIVPKKEPNDFPLFMTCHSQTEIPLTTTSQSISPQFAAMKP